jgi:hypothetical protein
MTFFPLLYPLLLPLSTCPDKISQQSHSYTPIFTACCKWMLLCTILCCTITYRPLGELGAAGLRAPPKCVVDPQLDLDNASVGKASTAATMQHLSMPHPSSLA